MLRIDTRGSNAVEIFSRTHHSILSSFSLDAGESVSGPDHRLEGFDHWMIVVSGRGEALVAGERLELRKGVVLLIERGEPHQIRACADAPLRALRVEAPGRA